MLKQHLQKPEVFLYLFAAAVPLSFATWQALINNFAIEQASFTGVEIGILQSLREVPGFLAFGVVFLLVMMREQTIAFVSLLALGIGTAITGMLPSVLGLYCTTVLMSVGFHYAETISQSLSLQLVNYQRLPLVLGRQLAVGSFTGLTVFAVIYLLVEWLALDYLWIYLLFGCFTVVLACVMYFACPHFKGEAEQHKTMVLRKRYWLYYLLTFLSGARRQIFVVFAGFLMVEKFGFTVSQMTLLFLVNGVLTIYLAPRIGRLVSYWGEKRTLTLEYGGHFYRLCICRKRLVCSVALHPRPRVFRDGDRAQELSQENCRPRRYGGNRWSLVFDQSHRRGGIAVFSGPAVGGFATTGVYHRRRNRAGLFALVATRAGRTRARHGNRVFQRLSGRAQAGSNWQLGVDAESSCSAADISASIPSNSGVDR